MGIGVSATAALLALVGCGEAPPAPAANHAEAPEPMPPAQDLAEDGELANRAAEAEALDAEIGGNNSGAEANLQ